MRVVRIAGLLVAGFLVQDARAQGPASPVLAPSSTSFGRLGVMAGIMYERSYAYSAQLSGLYYLTPENRPLSFRVQAYAAWSPFQTVTSRTASSGIIVNSGSSTQVGGAIAAILHARPKSRVSPYFIASYGISQRWQNGTDQVLDVGGQAIEPRTKWVRSYTWGEFGLGVGIRARVGGQMLRLEVTSTSNRVAVSLGMSLPF